MRKVGRGPARRLIFMTPYWYTMAKVRVVSLPQLTLLLLACAAITSAVAWAILRPQRPAVVETVRYLPAPAPEQDLPRPVFGPASGPVAPPMRAGQVQLVPPEPPINPARNGPAPGASQIGTLTADLPTGRRVLPLFAQKNGLNRDRWAYYTKTGGIDAVTIPVMLGRRNCLTFEFGCGMLNEGDRVQVPQIGDGDFTVALYRDFYD